MNVRLVCLEAADNVLIERAAGKRIDPKTKGFCHSNGIFSCDCIEISSFRDLSYHLEYSQFA